MHWGDIKLRYKLFCAFSLILSLLLIVGFIGFRGVNVVTRNAQTVILGNQLDRLLAQKEIDHLNWMSKINRLWTDPQASRVDAQTDDHECAFGQWLYGPGRKQLESSYPDMAALLKRIESPHHQLHASVIAINQKMDTSPDKNSGLMAASAVLHEKTLPALAQVQETLSAIRQSARDKIMTDEVMLAKAQSTRRLFVLAIVTAIALGLILSLFLAAYTSRPIIHAAEFVERLSQGEFTRTLSIKQQDEIGKLAQAINQLVANFGKMIREVNNGVSSLNSSSSDLSALSEQMNQGGEQTSIQAGTVAAAAEEMSVNMNNVAAASEQASGNVGMVATATEEMNATVKEIARNLEKARSITSEAVTQTQSASVKMDELGTAAKDISKVTEVITEISEQTNLLALNATIEAARAGEAGKGFTVVANEIKELAKQTAQATQEIKQKIGGIQFSTSDTVAKIKQISEVIVEVNEIVAGIAAAVEEQSMAVQEIAGNVSQASQGIREVNANVSQSSTVAGEISKEIAGVNLSADEMATSSSQIHISAKDLQKLAARLTQTVSQFKISAARFDIGAVKGAHLKWRSRLEGLFHGREALKPEEVASHHECDFGKWYDSPSGQAFKNIPMFAAVGKHHEKVHAHALQLVEFFHQNEGRQAAALMESFEAEREKFFAALDALYSA